MEKIKVSLNYSEIFDLNDKEVQDNMLFWEFGSDANKHQFDELSMETIYEHLKSIVFLNIDDEHASIEIL